MHKLNTEQTGNMKHHATPTSKQQQAEKFARILTAMGGESENEGLIRAFRQQQASTDGDKGTKTPSNAAANGPAAADGAPIGISSNHSSTDSETGPVTPNAAAAEAAAASEHSGSTINFRPSDPILLDAYRMLATSPTVPQVGNPFAQCCCHWRSCYSAKKSIILFFRSA